MRSSKLFLSTPIAVVILLTACGPSDPGGETSSDPAPQVTAPPLDGTAWQLTSITAIGGFVFTPENSSDYIVRFRSEQRFVVESDCNYAGAAWTQQGNKLILEGFNSSQAMCPPGTLHNHFVSNLMNVNAFSMADEQLVFTTDYEGVQLVFEPLQRSSSQ